MFKSIDYNLRILLVVLIVIACTLPVLYIKSHYVSFGIGIILLALTVYQLNKLYSKLSDNVVFLFNAIESGDYSFRFQDHIGSMREKELHRVMNKIKEILAQTKHDIVEQERFFSLVIENVSTGIIILDQNNHVKQVNQSAHQLLGLPVLTHLNQLRALDKSFPQLFKELKPQKEAKLLKVNTEQGEFQLSLRSDRIRMQKGEIKILLLNDINSELAQQEMDSWIKLIRVLTHEIMNSIAPITSLTDTMLYKFKNSDEEFKEKSSLLEGLDTIHTTSQELLQFVQSYRQFTRIPTPEPVTFDAVELIQKAFHLVQSNKEAQVVDIKLISPPEYTLRADKGHFLQLILNLLKNAVEAVLNSTDKVIEVEINDTNSMYSVIEVKNKGVPISKEIASQIFIPFFTTKEQGSGIGLSISRYIMRLHGGNLFLHQNEGWTIFSLSFPKIEKGN